MSKSSSQYVLNGLNTTFTDAAGDDAGASFVNAAAGLITAGVAEDVAEAAAAAAASLLSYSTAHACHDLPAVSGAKSTDVAAVPNEKTEGALVVEVAMRNEANSRGGGSCSGMQERCIGRRWCSGRRPRSSAGLG